MIVATIRPGYVIRCDDGREFTVRGSSKLRGVYRYTVKDQAGRVSTIRRDDVLEAQREGSAKVLAA
jgi:hypothetical protein